MRVLVKIAYDGTGFAGYQIQPKDRTVQGEFESALASILDGPVATIAAGRTDSGVHAAGQYVSFVSTRDSISADQWVPALNGRLPRDIRVQSARLVSESFNPRFHALRRHYVYRLYESPSDEPLRRLYAYRVGHRLDIEALNRDAAELVGTHDFAVFATAGAEVSDTKRTVLYADFARRRDEVIFGICANGFLWRMVRSIVGTLIERDRDRFRQREPVLSVGELLRSRDRSKAGTTAPPHGLCLNEVDYT